jgi:hypothetical protein
MPSILWKILGFKGADWSRWIGIRIFKPLPPRQCLVQVQVLSSYLRWLTTVFPTLNLKTSHTEKAFFRRCSRTLHTSLLHPRPWMVRKSMDQQGHDEFGTHQVDRYQRPSSTVTNCISCEVWSHCALYLFRITYNRFDVGTIWLSNFSKSSPCRSMRGDRHSISNFCWKIMYNYLRLAHGYL